LSKKFKKNPVEIAKDLSVKIKPEGFIKEIKEAGPYLNFYIDKGKMAEKVVKEILLKKEKYGLKKKTNKVVLVEYPGPNTNKPLHLGHVRNMALGYCLINLVNAAGYKAIPVNINNDRGVHICKSMLAYDKWGKGDTPEKSKMKSDFFVGKYYVMFNQKAKEHPELEKEALEWVKKWEEGDKKVRALWKKMNKWALDGFKETYNKFNIKFEKEYFESQTYEKGKEIVLGGLKKGLFEKDEEGAVFADLSKKNYGKKVLLRADGTSVYVTQDIYLAKERYDDFKYDKLIYVVATEQNYHFKVLFELLKILKFPFADKVYHFAYGMVNLPTGRMKSREGTVVDADEIVKDMEDLARKETKKRHKGISKKELDKRASQLGMAAIRFYMLKYEPIKDMLFDPEVSISFEGETGPYVQYAHARICSVLKKQKGKGKVNYKLLDTKEEEKLFREQKLVSLLSQYPETVEQAGTLYRPHLITRYLLDLSQSFNEFYHSCPILQAPKPIMEARLKLITAVKQVLANGLNLLGIEAPEEM
jgi:arginyl-tRNA synthetase